MSSDLLPHLMDGCARLIPMATSSMGIGQHSAGFIELALKVDPLGQGLEVTMTKGGAGAALVSEVQMRMRLRKSAAAEPEAVSRRRKSGPL